MAKKKPTDTDATDTNQPERDIDEVKSQLYDQMNDDSLAGLRALVNEAKTIDELSEVIETQTDGDSDLGIICRSIVIGNWPPTTEEAI